MHQTRIDRLKAKRRRKRKLLTIVLRTILFTFVLLGACLVFYLLHNFWNHSQEKQPDQPAEQAGENKQAATVNLTFVGDVILTGHVETRLKENGYDFPYVHVHPYFQQDDFTVANLETPVTKTVHLLQQRVRLQVSTGGNSSYEGSRYRSGESG